jgi:hypothetical protein
MYPTVRGNDRVSRKAFLNSRDDSLLGFTIDFSHRIDRTRFRLDIQGGSKSASGVISPGFRDWNDRCRALACSEFEYIGL